MRDLTIDFSSLRFNLKEISKTRLLSQNINGRLLKLFMGIITSEIQELLDAIVDLMEYRTIQKAQGPQLDALGRIVGQIRLAYNYDEDYWFSPDKTDVQPDVGHWWSNPAEQANIEPMDDDTYRQWIWLKVLENHNKFSAKEEVENIIAEGINEEVGIARTGNMVGKIYCKDGISLTNYNLLSYHKDNLQVENQFVFPYSATTSISSVERR
jgi:hypothetical protein